ncbi:cyclic AMP response element-binding protein B isoform X1 [Drosophila rhopaloa]|uniref:Cyclic AMP response element-binding protein B isoform X1 n=1 Tax=Drosophila rhopaloa TaxID=1041015 RepID=A0A6P4F8Q6_DRORH|nr:cyclic AMP response element-binding protein B isoform X1 [Drosophila rhopaloa]XP_016986621.1 cyclic AMP response element-binding protein B isoform X1 [Drosophila rhopaloa]XP_016986622.1 cyclic AMP response element-binding protein B isoform X1 [Drosophila rhopaloa]
MDNSIVEENGNSSAASGSNDVVDVVVQQASAGGGGGGNPQQQQQQNPQSTTAGGPTGATNNSQGGGTATVLTTTANCNLQYPIQALAQHGLQVQSVIQANPSGVIQTAAGTQQQQQQQALAAATAMHKVVYVAKPPNSTVIHTTPGNAVQVRNKIPPTFPCKIKPEPTTQHPEDSDESLSDDDSQHHRSELTRRPSYNKIFTEISGPDISGASLPMSDSVLNTQLAGSGAGGNAANSSLMQLDPTYYLSNRMPYNTNNSGIAEDQTRKREIRLQKNREAARECRRKKKEYIKCLENRVAVLENQNKALIEELKSLKELYCQTKND